MGKSEIAVTEPRVSVDVEPFLKIQHIEKLYRNILVNLNLPVNVCVVITKMKKAFDLLHDHGLLMSFMEEDTFE